MTKRKILLIYLVAFVILLGNIIFYFYSRLENPLYLKVYSELELNEKSNEEETVEKIFSVEPIEIIAIKNSDDRENKIIGAELPEFSNMPLKVGDFGDFYNSSDIGKYESMEIISDLSPGIKEYIDGKKYIERTELNFIGALKDNNIINEFLERPITKVNLILKNSKDGSIKKELVDIGERHIVKIDGEENLNEYAVRGLDNSSIWNCVFEFGEEVELKAVEMKSLDVFKKNYFLYINGKELNDIIFPINIKAQENIAVNIKARGKVYDKIDGQRINFIINHQGKDKIMKAMFTDIVTFSQLNLNDLKTLERLKGNSL